LINIFLHVRDKCTQKIFLLKEINKKIRYINSIISKDVIFVYGKKIFSKSLIKRKLQKLETDEFFSLRFLIRFYCFRQLVILKL